MKHLKRYFQPIFIAIGGLILILTFNNCGGFEAIEKAKNFGSGCFKKISNQFSESSLSSMSADESFAVNCGDFSRIQCELRVYSPEVGDSQTLENYCLTPAICVDVNYYAYSTQKVLDSGDYAAGSFDKGGEYYRTDARCGYVADAKVGHYSYAVDNVDLGAALEASIQKCKEATK